VIARIVKLAIVGSVVRRVSQNPAVATPAKSLVRRFSKRRAAGQWHHVDPPADAPSDRD
jgi:hypothetical protein